MSRMNRSRIFFWKNLRSKEKEENFKEISLIEKSEIVKMK
jgi:hypothetical protein